MSTYSVTCLEREGRVLRLRCRSLQDQDPDVLEATRSFVVAMLAERGGKMADALSVRGISEVFDADRASIPALRMALDALVERTQVTHREAPKAPRHSMPTWLSLANSQTTQSSRGSRSTPGLLGTVRP